MTILLTFNSKIAAHLESIIIRHEVRRRKGYDLGAVFPRRRLPQHEIRIDSVWQ